MSNNVVGYFGHKGVILRPRFYSDEEADGEEGMIEILDGKMGEGGNRR